MSKLDLGDGSPADGIMATAEKGPRHIPRVAKVKCYISFANKRKGALPLNLLQVLAAAVGPGCVKKAPHRHDAQNAAGISSLNARFLGNRSWIAPDAP
jgi:hypothetical protein